MRVHGRHLRLIQAYALRHAARSGAGLMFLILTLFFGLTVASIILAPIEQADQTVQREELVESLASMARRPVEWILLGSPGEDPSPELTAERERWSSNLLHDRPAVLSAIFVILLFGLPFLLPFGAFNQTAGEIGSRGLRYLLLRTERANIFFGRMLATLLFTALVLGLTVATIALYVGLRLELYPAADVLGWSLYGFVVLTVLALPYIALCAWISAANESAMASLVTCELVVGGVLLVALWGGAHNEYLGWCRYALPWGLQTRLFAPDIGQVLLAIAACLGYAAVFTALGYRKFTRRDL
jgi:ABC-type transport system involved in multi-copper enzyme maturation permease subunit